MALTNIRGQQIQDGTVQRADLDTSTVGQAVVAKIIQGTNISLSSTGGDAGTGDVTISSPTAVSTDSGNQATIGSDSRIYVPDPTTKITSVRLRSFNAVGNPNFEVAQRNIGGLLTNPASGTFVEDRWSVVGGTSLTGWTVQRTRSALTAGSGFQVPGTSFTITTGSVRFTVTTPTASLAAGQLLYLMQSVEGSQFRQLASDVHSVSLLVRSSVASLSFGLVLRDPGSTRSLTKLCTLGAANTLTLITLQNLPVFPSAGNFSMQEGVAGYLLGICLACGSTNLSPANDVWQTGSFTGATGQGNFMATNAATFDICLVQHEPGANCTTLIDKPFNQNLDECLRYFEKSYDYDTAIGTATTSPGAALYVQQTTTAVRGPIRFKKAMAKVPTVTAYNWNTGAINSVNFGGTNYAVSAINDTGKNSFDGLTTATLPAVTAGATCIGHYTADTGW